MCGIFGYVGSHTAEPILIEGLRTLEYRGYDSAGIFIPGYGAIKAVGSIDNLARKIKDTVPGTAGIAHTRWATHGAPTEVNAHPHQSVIGEKIWIVHNGIIENYRELRDELMKAGATFHTETDTEVLATLIGSLYKDDLKVAVQSALKRVSGTYGLAVMLAESDHEVVVARMGSPIVLGIGVDGHFVSSDPSALLAHTKDVVYLEDGEIAVVTKDGYSVETITGKATAKATETIEWDIESVQKQGYDHYLIKEIMEIPTAIKNTLRGRLIPGKGRAKLGGLDTVAAELKAVSEITIVGCGSAAYAGEVGRHFLETYAGVPTRVELASEYRYQAHPRTSGKQAVIAVTQSGETADTLAAIRLANEQGHLPLGIVNVVGSTIARETKAGVYNHAGPEVSIASTKAMVSQMTVLALMSLYLGRERRLSLQAGKEIAAALEELPGQIETVLKQKTQIERIASRFAHHPDMMFIGRLAHAPIAYEGALKLKEVTYLHAEAYAGGELKHGPIAMLDAGFPLVALVPEDDVFAKMISNIEEVRARDVPVIAITTEGAPQVEELATETIYVPKTHSLTQPIVSLIPTYLFAYYVGVAKGLNVDRPRNLAKSVTVE